MIVGITAFVLILCNGIILGRPGDPGSRSASGSATSSRCSPPRACASPATCARRYYTDARKPPGVL